MTRRKILSALLGALVASLRFAGFPIAAILNQKYFDRRNSLISELIQERLNGSEKTIRPVIGGSKFDERVVEYPEFVSFISGFKREIDLVDVGMTTNNPLTVEAIEKAVKRITFINPAPDQTIHVGCEYQVLSADMASAKVPPDSFDAVVSISTVEHIGWSNRHYGVLAKPVYSRPTIQPLLEFSSLAKAALKDGGLFFLSFPVGKSGRNLHPKTFRFGSQTIGPELLQPFLNLLRSDFEVTLRIWSTDGANWVPYEGGLHEIPESVWRKRYGQYVPAASGVAIILGRKRTS